MELIEHLRQLDDDKMAEALGSAMTRLALETERVDCDLYKMYPSMYNAVDGILAYYEKGNTSSEEIQMIRLGAKVLAITMAKYAENELLEQALE